MVVRWPKTWDDRVKMSRGSTSPLVTELRDILPTFLEVANHHPALTMDGKPITCLLLNDPSGAACNWRKWIDMELNIVYNDTIHWNALTDGTIKYVYNAYDGSEMLFDLIKDPTESHNCAADGAYHDALTQWRQRMVQQFIDEQRGDGWVKDGLLQKRVKGTLYSPHYPGNHTWIPHWNVPESSLPQYY
jgi:arylsulfatase